MDTLGSLIDKLNTVSLKMYHNQDTLYAMRKMTPAEFESAWGDNLDGLHDVIRRCCDLNVQRASLMDEIDRYFRDAIDGAIPTANLVREQHKTY